MSRLFAVNSGRHFYGLKPIMVDIPAFETEQTVVDIRTIAESVFE